MARKAIIIGAGPAGLTAAYELLTRTDIIPVIIEADKQVGGLSKTINYEGNRIDIGGHRFFSKSQKVISWWLKMLPLASTHPGEVNLRYHNSNKTIAAPDSFASPGSDVMLVRPRKSRIYYQQHFFDYPLQLNFDTLKKLGVSKTISIGISFLFAHLSPVKPEQNLADFFTNRFGKVLYETFFKDYTEKVWGVPCNKLPASWGYQRVKDLNFSKAFLQSLKSMFVSNKTLKQEGISSSLIEQFLYPPFGPGQMWETVCQKITAAGGTILFNQKVTDLTVKEGSITAVKYADQVTGQECEASADFFISTMPVRDLFRALNDRSKPPKVEAVATNLEYRNFIIVGLLIDHPLAHGGEILKDNWIYLQDKNVRAGRLQIFNNWSENMVKDPRTTWIGMEYFCSAGDELWNMSPEKIASMATSELQGIGLIHSVSEVITSAVEKVENAYPAYTGSYSQFGEIKDYMERFSNLFLIGRNGMHRYNNTDHSMLTAMAAVDNIISGERSKDNIWQINLDDEYHEEG